MWSLQHRPLGSVQLCGTMTREMGSEAGFRIAEVRACLEGSSQLKGVPNQEAPKCDMDLRFLLIPSWWFT